MRPMAGLRLAQPSDERFLFRLYASTREQESRMFGWDAAQLTPFLEMQFRTRRLAYEAQFPDAQTSIVVIGGEDAGVITVSRGAMKMVLVDIALASEYRNQGIGTRLLSALIAESEASGKPFTLSVLEDNPARRLYERLGFSVTAGERMYLAMERTPQRSIA
ncbi:MAG: GNAT family N-acetyltransferase [Acidobacteriaceae bacterium]|nr:GNAT family N-acetyltransferase [Acidobacteriaceae bacterium]